MVVGTFTVLLFPWLTSLSQLQQILLRVFPLARGVFEDKVANLWCFLSCLPLPARYKLRNLLDTTSLARISLLTTLIAILPTCIHLFSAGAQTVKIETAIDQDTRARFVASVAGSVTGPSSVTGGGGGGSVRGEAKRRSRKTSLAGSDAGTERVSVRSGRTAGGSAIRKPVLSGLPEIDSRPVAAVVPAPAAAILPYAMLSVSLAFFLFGFQVHEKSILLPLLPLTLVLSAKGDLYTGGSGATDWEWAVMTNNLATFSMWPLLQKDGLLLQYASILALWNWGIGYNPFAELRASRRTFIGWTSAVSLIDKILTLSVDC